MEIGREDKLDELGRVLESRSMHGSENLKSFLKFVVDKSLCDDTDQLKEYTIATEVFGRSNHFSPRNDSVVRVQASRLRSKLHEYYATEGKADRVRIELPKGHYNPVFSVVDSVPDDSQAPLNTLQEPNGAIATATPLTAVDKVSRHWKERRWLLAASGVTLFLVVVISLVFRDRGPGPVWEPFLRAGDQTLLVLSNPPVYRFTNSRDPDALIRDSITLTPNQIKRIEELLGDKFMIRNSPGQIILSKEQFTGMGEAIGLYCLTDLFRSGPSSAPEAKPNVSAEDLKNHNIILLGSVWVNEWSGKLPIKEDFAYTRNATIENRNPQPGEEPEYSPQFDSAGGLVEDYALITVKPNISGKNTVMILAGIHSEGTQAAAEYVAIPEYLTNLNQRLLQFSGPKYYQALLKVAVDNGIPTTISLLSVHELHAPRGLSANNANFARSE
jgi:hypothetical protein